MLLCRRIDSRVLASKEDGRFALRVSIPPCHFYQVDYFAYYGSLSLAIMGVSRHKGRFVAFAKDVRVCASTASRVASEDRMPFLSVFAYEHVMWCLSRGVALLCNVDLRSQAFKVGITRVGAITVSSDYVEGRSFRQVRDGAAFCRLIGAIAVRVNRSRLVGLYHSQSLVVAAPNVTVVSVKEFSSVPVGAPRRRVVVVSIIVTAVRHFRRREEVRAVGVTGNGFSARRDVFHSVVVIFVVQAIIASVLIATVTCLKVFRFKVHRFLSHASVSGEGMGKEVLTAQAVVCSAIVVDVPNHVSACMLSPASNDNVPGTYAV